MRAVESDGCCTWMLWETSDISWREHMPNTIMFENKVVRRQGRNSHAPWSNGVQGNGNKYIVQRIEKEQKTYTGSLEKETITKTISELTVLRHEATNQERPPCQGHRMGDRVNEKICEWLGIPETEEIQYFNHDIIKASFCCRRVISDFSNCIELNICCFAYFLSGSLVDIECYA